jgi:hypothetical protein
MPNYRAYMVGADGHIINRIEFTCADDDKAKDYAKAFVDGRDVELWELNRRGALLKADDQ